MYLRQGSGFILNRLFVREKTFYATLVKMGLPMLIQQFITMMVNMVATLMMGQFGETALSATALANQYYNLVYITCTGLSAGAAVLIAQFWGKRDLLSIRTVSSIMFRMLGVISVLFIIVTFFLAEQIMGVYTNEAAVIAEGMKYLRFIAFSFAFHAMTLSCTNTIRCAGVVKVPMYASMVSLVSTVFFNWVFIFGNLGVPKMGISGAGLSILISRVIEGTIVGLYTFIKDKQIGLRIKHLRLFDKNLLKNYLMNGGPVLLSDFSTTLGSNMISVIMGHMGSTFTAAVSIVSVITQISSILTHGVAGPSSVITGNTVGRGDKKRAYDQGVTFISMGVIFGIFAGLIITVIKGPFINLYNVEEVTKNIARQLVSVASIVVIFNVMDGILTKGVLRGGGDTKFMLVCEAVSVWVFAVPLGYLTAFKFGSPIWVVYLCLRSETIFKSVISLFRFFTKRWIHDVTKGAPAASLPDTADVDQMQEEIINEQI